MNRFGPQEVRAGGWDPAPGDAAPRTAAIPAWPLTALFAFYPVWWALGVVDIIWIPAALVMVYLLARSGTTRLPSGLGVWLLFMLWALCSAIELPTFSSGIAFAYRYLIYAASTVILLYVYNGRRNLTERYVSGVMTVFWLVTVAGGFLGVLFPTVTLQTLVARVLEIDRVRGVFPSVVLQNDLVQQMIVRRFSQFNPDAYTLIAPRPSAPFLYTNNWGNAYSLLIPFVVIYLMHVGPHRKRFWLLAAALLASVAPAFLTLNRGMFFGLALALVYAAVRAALLGHSRGLALVALVGMVGAIAFTVLPIQARLDQRLEANSSTVTRASLYQAVLQEVPTSPFFGEGGPRASTNPYAPPVGTQGQVWLVLFSHGIGGAILFMGWFALTFGLTWGRRDAAGIAWSTVVLVATVEFLYYGAVPSGLPLVMVGAALALRGKDEASAPSELPSTELRGRLVAERPLRN